MGALRAGVGVMPGWVERRTGAPPGPDSPTPRQFGQQHDAFTRDLDVATVRQVASDALPQRFVSLSPGMMLGETAMLDGGGRSGDAVAFGETDVYSLDSGALLQVRSDAPMLYAQIHRNIGVHLSQRLRAASSAWRVSTR